VWVRFDPDLYLKRQVVDHLAHCSEKAAYHRSQTDNLNTAMEK